MLRIRTITASALPRHKGTLWAVSSLGLFFAGVLIFGRLVASPDEASHALEHLSRGAPIVLLALAFHRLWRPRSPSIRVARALLMSSHAPEPGGKPDAHYLLLVEGAEDRYYPKQQYWHR